MSTLKEILSNFQPEAGIELLNEQFMELAKSFLYDGYIVVNDSNEERYRIYIRTVEFYCHYEGDTTEDESWRRDWIVYHRNNHYVEGEIPYWKNLSMTLPDGHCCRIDGNLNVKIRKSTVLLEFFKPR